jgi:uncharacterized protein (DUF58 family)
MIVEGVMTGMHRSPYQGFSVEFAQHRQYAFGDDIRHLDWKVFGRTDKLYLKQYQQETNLDLVLMVDASGSMGYSSMKPPKVGVRAWRKYDHAAALAASLGYMALRQQDRVALVMFANTVRNATRTSNAHDHWRSIVEVLSGEPLEEDTAHVLAGETTERTTDLGKLFDQMTAKLSRRSLLVLSSDLFDTPEALERGLALLKFRGHDLIVFQVLDDAELNFPFRSPSDFIGLENEGRLGLDPAALREAYLEAINTHVTAVEDLTRRFGFDYLLVNSHESLSAPLGYFLARRAAMLSRGGRRK